MVRSLKTYGITCYQVEERTPKGPRTILLGIAAEKIYRMDAQTKVRGVFSLLSSKEAALGHGSTHVCSQEVYLQHPITHLRRYAATHNSITLDFADYETEYMTFRTKQAEEILQLISGYIDIFMKKKKSARCHPLITVLASYLTMLRRYGRRCAERRIGDGADHRGRSCNWRQLSVIYQVCLTVHRYVCPEYLCISVPVFFLNANILADVAASTIGLSTNPHPQGEQMQISHAGMASQYGSVRPLTYQQLQVVLF
jgi:hypothetical protein